MRTVVECKDTDEIIGAKETIAAAIDGLADIKFINVETESNVMGKQFFTDYVRHMARFYFRSDLGQMQVFKTVCDERNWKSCHNASKSFDKNMLIAVYAPGNDIGSNVIAVADRFGKEEGEVWEIVREFEELAARKRGLI